MNYGVVPAGGLGSRMSHLGYSKELVKVNGLPVIEYILARLTLIKIKKIYVTSHPDKQDLNHYLLEDSPHKHKIEVVLGERRGLLDGIVSPAKFLKPNDNLYFGLPDTIWFPTDGFKQISTFSDPLVLGLIAQPNPSLYGSVVLNSSGSISKIVEKPAVPESPWIWAFGKILVNIIPELILLEKNNPHLVFTDILGLYSQQFGGRGVTLNDGKYLDVGIPDNLAQAETFVNET